MDLQALHRFRICSWNLFSMQLKKGCNLLLVVRVHDANAVLEPEVINPAHTLQGHMTRLTNEKPIFLVEDEQVLGEAKVHSQLGPCSRPDFSVVVMISIKIPQFVTNTGTWRAGRGAGRGAGSRAGLVWFVVVLCGKVDANMVSGGLAKAALRTLKEGITRLIIITIITVIIITDRASEFEGCGAILETSAVFQR